MDIVAHGIWVGLGLAFASRYTPIARSTVCTTVALSVAPDLLHLLPVLVWAPLQPDGFKTLIAYAIATPKTEPTLPYLVDLIAHHLHCVMHSAVVVAIVSLFLWLFKQAHWLPVLGWLSHVLIDVFTHSADFYPSPVFYPFSYRGFDGIAWNTSWFMLANYTAIAVAGVALFFDTKRGKQI